MENKKLYCVRSPKYKGEDEKPLTVADFIKEIDLIGETPRRYIIKDEQTGHEIRIKKGVYGYFRTYAAAVDDLRLRLLITLTGNKSEISKLNLLNAIYEKVLKEANEINGITGKKEDVKEEGNR